MMLHVEPAAHAFPRARDVREKWAAAQAALQHAGEEASASRGRQRRTAAVGGAELRKHQARKSRPVWGGAKLVPCKP